MCLPFTPDGFDDYPRCGMDQSFIPCFGLKGWLYHILFILQHLGCFHFLTILDNVAVNIYVRVIVRMYAFNSLGYLSRSGIAGSYGDSG